MIDAKRLRIVLISPKGPLYRHRGGIFGRALRYKPLTLTTLAALIPAELNAEVEFVDDAGHAKRAHELGAGEEYSLVVTTSGGLRRYRLRDRVRVTGFEQECPLLRFVGKEAPVSDHFGEKLSELHVRSAWEAIGLEAEFALVACEGKAYTLFVETAEADDRLVTAADEFESALQRNVHYRYCRQLGQLQSLRVFRISHNGRSAWLMGCVRQGQRLGEIKPLVLSRHNGWVQVFSGSYLNLQAAV